MLETQPCSGGSRRFGNLRGVQWRIDMGILPSSSSASVDDLRRVAADSRRRYAALRRQLLVDPHVPKDGSSSPDLVMDNPLSQNPDSMWGRFFRNAELERMVDQDLTRLYPEKGSYFQTSGCQGMLRRILLLWCLRHPEYGYRQGMHELLAPLLYVLHVDVERLSEVRKTYDDHFADKFDGFSFHENDLTYKFDFKKVSESINDGDGLERSSAKASSLSELDPEIKMIVLLSDAYGAEGELGIVLSEKFMEHDAYCMFDALMSGTGGAVVMAEFFSPSPVGSSHTGFPPVIEASAALYHLLSIVDSSLHSHLVELGVEPQYFALRWLRVLFGREFSLEDLLVIWDETLTHENTRHNKAVGIDAESDFGVLESARGAFICSFAVSMILNLRSSLLATENATTCLQRLLNFPDDVKLVRLIEKAKSLHVLAIDANNSSSLPIHPGLYDGRKPVIARGHRLSLDSTSLGTPLNTVPDSYWEEKWRVMHSEEKNKQNASGEQAPNRRKGWSERVRQRLSRTESDPSPSKRNERTKISNPAVRKSLLEDLERQLGSNGDKENTETGPFPSKENVIAKNSKSAVRRSLLEDLERQPGSNEDKENTESDPSLSEENERTKNSKPAVRRSLLEDLEHQLGSSEDKENRVFDEYVDHQDSVDVDGEDVTDKNNDSTSSGAESEKINFNFSYPTGPRGNSDNENDRERISSAASNSSIDENDAEPYGTMSECYTLAVSDPPDSLSSKCTQNDDSVGKSSAATKDKKLIFGKFQWLWKFGRNAGDETSERVSAPEDATACNGGSDQNSVTSISTADTCKGETVDQNLMVSLKNLGQSMLENIQVIESVVQQDRGQTGSLENLGKNGLVGRGQGTAIAALKELRKISNLLSEM